MTNKKLKITLKEWDYTCGDGCCTNYGTQILIDGKEVEHYDEEVVVNAYVGCDVEVAIRSVLKHLGFENVEIEREHEAD